MLDELLDLFDRDRRDGGAATRRRGFRGWLDRLRSDGDDDRDSGDGRRDPRPRQRRNDDADFGLD